MILMVYDERENIMFNIITDAYMNSAQHFRSYRRL